MHLDCRENVSLKERTTFKIGGAAEHLFVAHSIDDLGAIIVKVTAHWGRFYFLGGGSNILISDKSIVPPVLTLGEEFSYIRRIDQGHLEVGAATPLAKVIGFMIREHILCLENFIGIPAQIGGLIVMNASSFGRAIAAAVEQVCLIDQGGNTKTVKGDAVEFGYRSSSLQGSIVLAVQLRITEENDVKAKMVPYIKERFATQDLFFPSAGCIFKNTTTHPAAYLIDQCGLRGLARGGACVSGKHANFIVNRENARAEDVVGIIECIKEKVYKKFGVVLEEEIKRWEI